MQAILWLGISGAAAFVWFSSGGLPEVVASHFGASGAANGFMSRRLYVALMLGVVIALPLLVGWSAKLVAVLPAHLVNLPNRDFWLSPERRGTTALALSKLCVPFALTLAAFFCFVHWLVLQANASQVHTLSTPSLAVATVIFGIVTVAWLFLLRHRFARVA